MKIALAQINPTVGDIQGNSELIGRAIDGARERGARLVVFPELAVCGYPPRDLLNNESFVETCQAAADRIGLGQTRGIGLVLGTPLRRDDGRIANGLAVFDDNAGVARYEKRLLPTYDVFDEDRYFVPGDAPVVVEFDGRRVGLAVCEDLWRGQDAGASARYAARPDPIEAYGRENISLLVAPSASPFVLGKHGKHRQIVSQTADRLGVPVVSVNQAGANDDLVFDGRSCVVAPGGRTIRECSAFEPDLIAVDTRGTGTDSPARVIDDERLLIEALTVGTRDYIGKCGFRSACLGLSGGIDSALTAAIAARAIGGDHVIGAAMPGPFSSEGSITDAYALAENLGMPCITMPIADAFGGHRSTLDRAFADLGRPILGAQRPDHTEENLQSRVRGALMMGLSNRTGAILLTTGNKSELAVGYCTLYGDMNGGLAVISDVPKTLVYRACRYMNEHHRSLGFARPPIPEPTIEKPPSAELAPGQLDTDSLPPYDVLDEIVHRRVERRESIDTIRTGTGFDRELIERVCRLIRINEHKRRQYAVGLKVTSIAFGPGRRMPVAQRWTG